MNTNHTIKSYMHKTGVHTACQIADSFYGSTPDPVLGLCSPSNMPYPWIGIYRDFHSPALLSEPLKNLECSSPYYYLKLDVSTFVRGIHQKQLVLRQRPLTELETSNFR